MRVIFKAEKLPIIYRHRFMAVIKDALNRSAPDYEHCLYPDKGSKFSKKTKPFTFNISMPPGKTVIKERFSIDRGVEVEDKVFYFPQNAFLSFYLSSSDYNFIVNLYNGLLELKEFKFSDDILLRLEKVFMLHEKKISGDDMMFKTNSPILIEDKDGKPLLPSAANLQSFNGHFNAIHDRILKDIRGEGLYREIEFVPVKLKKQVVKHTLKGFREETGKPYMTLTCFEGCFKLKGDQHDLQMLYQIGIGLRTGQGFGMIETV